MQIDLCAKKINNIHNLEVLKKKINVESNNELIKIIMGVIKQGINESEKVVACNKIKYLSNSIVFLDQLLDITLIPDYSNLLRELLHLSKMMESSINNITDPKVKKFMEIEQDALTEVIEKDRDEEKDREDIYNTILSLVINAKSINDIKAVFNKNQSLYKIDRFKSKAFLFKILDEYIKVIYTMDVNRILYYEKVLNFFLNNSKNKVEQCVKDQLIQKLTACKDVIYEFENYDREGKKYYLDRGISTIKDKKEDIIKKFDYSKNKNLLLEIAQLKSNKYGMILDLRDKFVFTIDSKGAQSLDDALSFEILPNGNYLLGVYIADVNAFVSEGSEIDKRAYNMGQTIYSRDNHITMLDPKLSLNLCSLNKNQDRYAYAFLFEIDKDYNLVNSRVANAIINVTNKYNYEDVERIILKPNFNMDSFVISSLYQVASNINADKNEMIKYHAEKEKIDPARKSNPNYQVNIGSLIVDDIKVFTNNYIAQFFYDSGLPFIYRNNSSNNNQELIRKLNSVCDGNPKVIDIISPIAHDYSDSTYSHINLGHYGLNKKAYAHATTPIRNYSSMFNQRLIQKLMIEKSLPDKEIYRYERLVALVATHLNVQIEQNDEFANSHRR